MVVARRQRKRDTIRDTRDDASSPVRDESDEDERYGAFVGGEPTHKFTCSVRIPARERERERERRGEDSRVRACETKKRSCGKLARSSWRKQPLAKSTLVRVAPTSRNDTLTHVRSFHSTASNPRTKENLNFIFKFLHFLK